MVSGVHALDPGLRITNADRPGKLFVARERGIAFSSTQREQVIFARIRLRDVVRWLGLALALALLAKLLLGPEGVIGLSLLRDRGPVVLVGLLPFLAFELIDTAVWRRLIRPLGYAPRYLSLLRTRISAEAVNLTLPAGSALAEAITPSLLQRGCGIAIRDGVVALAARRWTVLRAHAVYLLTGGVVGLRDHGGRVRRIGHGRAEAPAGHELHA